MPAPAQQGRDVDAELPEHREHRERQDDHLSGAAHQRHDRAEAGASLSALALELPLVLPVEPQGRALDRDLPIGHDLEQLPQAVGDDADQEHLQQGARELRADPLRGEVAEIEPPHPREDEDQHERGDRPPAAHEPELGLLVGGAQGRILLRIVGPDRLDEGVYRQFDQGQPQHEREGDVQRGGREALQVSGRGEELHDQPLKHDEHDGDHRPSRREAVPGRTVVTLAEHDPGDAGPAPATG